MKKIMYFFFAMSIVGFLSFSSCKQGGEGSEKKDSAKTTTVNEGEDKKTCTDKSVDTKGKEYTSDFVCPHHCKGSGSDKAGKCSECDMDLMENPNKAN